MIDTPQPHIRVISPGFQTTVQDLGRYGYAHLGVSASGAADPLSLRLGNLLVGNPENTAALEMTLTGGTFEFESDSLIALTGSDFRPELDGKPVPMWSSVAMKSGQRLCCGSTKDGARCYLSVKGGIMIPLVFGSASTHLQTGLGGFGGRALEKGDVLTAGVADRMNSEPPRRINASFLKYKLSRNVLRIVSVSRSDMFPQKLLNVLCTSTYTILEESNRMGLRLDGPPLLHTGTKEILTEGVSSGAVQLPQNGKPIILFVEHQTTGGYPQIASVISADFHILGQLKPRDEIRFQLVSLNQAWAMLRDQESAIASQKLFMQL
jgi:antagonist of KipI